MSNKSKLYKLLALSQPFRIVRRFKKNEDGATAVEFAIVAGPFFLLVFAIIETSLLFFANQYIETVVDDVARLYRTGQLTNISTQSDLKQEMCRRVVALFDCNKLILQVDVSPKFSTLPPPPTSTDADSSGVYAPTERFPPYFCSKEVLQFTASYLWPIYANYSAPLVSDGLKDAALISVTAVVRTEGFADPAGATCPRP